MNISLQPISDAARWIWNHPGQSSIKAGQAIAALAVSYVAYTAARQIHGIPCVCTCSCIPSASIEAGTKLVTVLGLMLASVVIARHNFFAAKPLPKVPPLSLDSVKSPGRK